jgi:dihydroorotase/N-acyl-D-amino-acid deacylase
MRASFALIFGGVMTLAAQPYDLLITGGRIIDGSGSPYFHGDIAIRGDSIAAIGKLASSDARVRIDASGLVVAPGFIDIHSHAGRLVRENPALESAVRQGVTTVLEGQDGSSPVPLGAALKSLASIPVTINFGYFVGQGAIRNAVMGSVNRVATPEELARMKALARDAMLDGAFGLSTGLFYVPGNFTPTEEVIELARVVGEYGGMHISHMRDEATHVFDSVRETIRIGEEGRLPTQITHHKIIGKANWGNSRKTLQIVEEARERGVDITLDQYPYTASHTATTALFPQWSLEGGASALKERLQAPEQRSRIEAEIVRRIRDDRGGGSAENIQLSRCDYDPSLAGKTLADVTRARGLEPTLENAAATAIEIQEKGGCYAIYHSMSEEDLERILSFPWTMIASDGEAPVFGSASPHPRAYGTFPRVLGRYTREKRLFSLEEAIRKMTALPAWRLKIFDRGLLRPGMYADIAIFDPGVIADRSEFKNPHQYSVGVKHVVVNGRPVLLDGKMTGTRSGRVLHGPAKR